jgi:tRNA 2-thiouridine synthesizing protein A
VGDIEILDARRLLCPLPVIRCQDRIAEMAVGSRLKVICTDPGALYDVPAWCRIHGHSVVDAQEIDDEYVITVEVGDRT